ncbi:MAG: hypothetical protein QXR18_02830 [Pyrobaculum sp.]
MWLEDIDKCLKSPEELVESGGLGRVKECRRKLEEVLKRGDISNYQRNRLEWAVNNINSFLENLEKRGVEVEVGRVFLGMEFPLYVVNKSPLPCTGVVEIEGVSGVVKREFDVGAWGRIYIGDFKAEKRKIKIHIQARWEHLEGEKKFEKLIEAEEAKEYKEDAARHEAQDRGREGALRHVVLNRERETPDVKPYVGGDVAQLQQVPSGGVFQIERLLEEGFKHALAVAVGYFIGKRMAEPKAMEKPVYAASDVPYVRHGGITYVLADPLEVVVEDKGKFLYLRRARPAEILSEITAKAAERLTNDFRQRFLKAYSSWRIKEEIRNRGLVLKAKRGVVGGVSILAAVYLRRDRLESRGVDHEPADLGEVVRELNLEKYLKNIIILASPTGWTPQSIEQAVRSNNIALINLKTGEAFHAPVEKCIDDLANPPGCATATMGYGIVTTLPEGVEEYDMQLVSGTIDEKTYLNLVELKRLGSPR